MPVTGESMRKDLALFCSPSRMFATPFPKRHPRALYVHFHTCLCSVISGADRGLESSENLGSLQQVTRYSSCLLQMVLNAFIQPLFICLRLKSPFSVFVTVVRTAQNRSHTKIQALKPHICCSSPPAAPVFHASTSFDCLPLNCAECLIGSPITSQHTAKSPPMPQLLPELLPLSSALAPAWSSNPAAQQSKAESDSTPSPHMGPYPHANNCRDETTGCCSA